jgi:hypothetical protein
MVPRKELKPQMRRSSTTLTGGSGRRRSSVTAISPTREKAGVSPEKWTPSSHEHAIVDEDDEKLEVDLKDGYKSGTGSDAEEDETADEIIMKEVEKRGAKEG